MALHLFRTKSLDAILGEGEKSPLKLKRVLGPFDAVMIGIGGIIGAGIFATLGFAAAGDLSRPGAGPALILSFALTAVACLFAALCYAEFASMIPISGSAYTYAYSTLGELAAWIIGWNLLIEFGIGNVAVAVSWSNYLKNFVAGFGLTIPGWLSTSYSAAGKIPGLLDAAPHILGVPIVINLPAFAIVGVITVLLVIGIRESSRTNAAMVIVKLLVLALFIAVGARYVKPANWTPFSPNGWTGVQAGAAIVFFAYIGFDAVATVAEEMRNPTRNIPIGIIGSLAICTVIYIVVAAVFTGILPYPELTRMLTESPGEPLTLTFALQYAGVERWGNAVVGLIALGALVAHTAVLLVFQLGQSRVFYAMSRDGLLPKSFASVHPRFRTPHVNTILTGAAVGLTAMFTGIEAMVDLTNIGTLFVFILVCAGILILRRTEPGRPRPFRTPLVPLVPILGILSCLYLMLGIPWITWARFAAWLAAGTAIYLLYGYRRSRLNAVPGAREVRSLQ
jgi:APA family basic amino acid/polyamine antiporter